MEAVVFFICAAVIMVGAFGVILFKNPVHAALSLVLTLFGVAVQFINLEAYFLAAIQVIVYAGAIVVVFVFVIMLLGVDKSEEVEIEPIVGQRQLAVLVGAGVIALGLIVGLSVGGSATGAPPAPGSNLAIQEATVPDPTSLSIDPADQRVVEDPEATNVKQLGRVIFTDYVFAFEITAILLTIAVVGAVVLARKPKGELQELPVVERPGMFRSDIP